MSSNPLILHEQFNDQVFSGLYNGDEISVRQRSLMFDWQQRNDTWGTPLLAILSGNLWEAPDWMFHRKVALTRWAMSLGARPDHHAPLKCEWWIEFPWEDLVLGGTSAVSLVSNALHLGAENDYPHNSLAMHRLRVFREVLAAATFAPTMHRVDVRASVPQLWEMILKDTNSSDFEFVDTLRRRAQTALGVGRSRLLDQSGRALAVCAVVKDSKLQNGDSLTLHLSQVQACATDSAFAAILGDGSVVTWGGADKSGDSSAVQDQLKNVQQIQASRSAFAAILGDGSVVTWGESDYGGDSSAVQDQLKNVQQIQAAGNAFAAILGDGSVVTWGSAHHGGDSRAVQDQLKNVRQIQSNEYAFAAILGDGSVVTWGAAGYGGASGAVQDRLKNVQQIQACVTFDGGAFAAILGDGSVVTWGDAGSGGDSSAAQDQLKNVQQIQVSSGAFAAILGDGSVVTWGHAAYGADTGAVQHQLKTVQQVQASSRVGGFAFAAVLHSGAVVTWGDADCGGDSTAVQDQLTNVSQIQATCRAFAAILENGSVVTWGDADYGGDSGFVQEQLKNVQQIQSSCRAFAAILGDGSVVTWGDADYGGDSSGVQDQLKNAEQIQASNCAFVAILGNGFVATWGGAAYGGNSSSLQDHLRVTSSGSVLAHVAVLQEACPKLPAIKSRSSHGDIVREEVPYSWAAMKHFTSLLYCGCFAEGLQIYEGDCSTLVELADAAICFSAQALIPMLAMHLRCQLQQASFGPICSFALRHGHDSLLEDCRYFARRFYHEDMGSQSWDAFHQSLPSSVQRFLRAEVSSEHRFAE
ncbi:putative E3 ubiquitin-protein ligase HERC2 [Symbiodinium microadriaticum]|uniref:Putative E3 ubiquitin-protein ligase HERC2 n=1 Tax=Symbiodinium microadriaticum TaxID=2951 RepID=A0A1Q9EDA3_SYMMI|nr:putative E3 ubiquitin-protein ligase HERC2 [Symbiodinium microadriaticum]